MLILQRVPGSLLPSATLNMIYLDEAGNWDILERCGNDALKGKRCLNQNGMVK